MERVAIVELLITYDGRSKFIIYQKDWSLEVFYLELKNIFNIQGRIKLYDGEAEITSSLSFVNGRKLTIIIEEEAREELLPSPNAVSETMSIDLSLIKDVEYDTEELVDKLNQWAFPQKFKLVKTGGIRNLADGFSRSVICSEKKCHFRLNFKSNINGIKYKLDLKLSGKNNKHSKHNTLKFFYLI